MEKAINKSQWGLEEFLHFLHDLKLNLCEYLLWFHQVFILLRKGITQKREKIPCTARILFQESAWTPDV